MMQDSIAALSFAVRIVFAGILWQLINVKPVMANAVKSFCR